MPTLSPDDLPFLTHAYGAIPGQVRTEPEDFRVDEIPAYAPSGTGAHLYVHFEKRGLTTQEAVRRIARALATNPRDAGWAGMKDQNAVTTQWASFQVQSDDDLSRAVIDGVRVLEVSRHTNKLRTGHLRGNRFHLLVRDAPNERLEDVRCVLADLVARGVPNYFGPQRFGIGGGNIERAQRWLLDGGAPPRDRFERKLLVSVLQAALFNRYLASRLGDGLIDRPIEGDLMRKEDTGGLFVAEELDETGRRMANWEISATGPMFGAKMRSPDAVARERELSVLASAGVEPSHLAGFARYGEGTRRPVRIRIAEHALEPMGEGFSLRFVLPSGAYATAVLREVLKRDVS